MIVATLVRKDQIVHAIALAKSVKAHYPKAVFVACLIQHLVPAAKTSIFDEVILINNNNFPAESAENFCGARAYLIKHLLETYDNEIILYMDPETKVFSPFNEVIHLLQTHSIIATPFHLEITDSSTEVERLQSGVLNAGFLALRNSVAAKRFAAWWSDHIDQKFYDAQKGNSADHKWLSLAMVPHEIYLLKNAAYQVAPWNLHESRRKIEYAKDNQFVIGDQPLRSFHFTYSNSLIEHKLKSSVPDENSPVYALVQSYKDELKSIRLKGGVQ